MKILLADDEPIARTMLEHWLTGWGYKVTTVKDGEAALAALKADPEIHLAVVDWVMPKVDGPAVCRTVRAGPSEPYVYLVLLTARDNKADIVAGLDAGADDYLIKPCNPLELKVRLRAGSRVVELQQQLVAARESLRFEAMHDGLTGILNRRAVLEHLERELARSQRKGGPLAVLMADLDYFKKVNDTYGHEVGDVVLKEAARRINTCVRAYDSLGRMGGEEFLAVLPDCGGGMALSVAERVGAAVAQVPVETPVGPVPISVSIGVASTEQVEAVAVSDLTRAADAALYRAKHAGRARACLAVPAEFAVKRSGEQAFPSGISVARARA
ncbi:MAG TPA: diguanylate cyclase [Polyangiaceae bacterium]|nr:diguanylate cyclase [Polyangiaceae bacterium]